MVLLIRGGGCGIIPANVCFCGIIFKSLFLHQTHNAMSDHPQKNDPNQQKREIDPQEGEMEGNVFRKPFEFVFGATPKEETKKDTDVQDRAGEHIDEEDKTNTGKEDKV